MRPMSIRALGSAGSAGAGEPPSCATADSEGGEAGLEVAGEVTGPSNDASPLPPPVAVSAAAAAACSEPSAAANNESRCNPRLLGGVCRGWGGWLVG